MGVGLRIDELANRLRVFAHSDGGRCEKWAQVRLLVRVDLVYRLIAPQMVQICLPRPDVAATR